MKRIIALILTVMVVLSFAACGKEKVSEKKKSEPMEILPTLAVDTEVTGIVEENTPMDRKITLGNKEYDFPILISELIDDGWYFDENARERLETQGVVEAQTVAELSDMSLYHDGYGLRIMLLAARNESENQQILRDCRLTKLGINRSMMEDADKVNIVLPGGVTFGSTAADVVSVYGEEENDIFHTVALNGSEAEYAGELFTVSFTFFEDGTIEYICFS